VLGWSPVARTVIDSVRERPGDLHVVSAVRSRVDSLRDDGVDAQLGDPGDPDCYPNAVSSVVVAGANPTPNLDAARAARERFPDAYLVAYAGDDPSEETLDALQSLADEVVDPHRAVAEHVVAFTGDPTVNRLSRLLRTLRRIDGRLAVVMHDNPDPDAIGSALALVRIAERVGVDATPCYFGEISHQENRAMINLLDLNLRNLDPGTDMSDYDGVALVDHSRPGVNDGLPPETHVDIAIDHHPPRAPVEARYLDLRSDVGATSTLLTEYLRRLQLEPDTTLATALLFGIRVDTREFSREVSVADFEAAAYLCPWVDQSVLDRIEQPSMSPEVLETLGRAIRNREVRSDALATNVGEITDRDALAQAADHLLGMERVNITLVYGHRDGTVYVSGRARGTSVDVGETLRDALGPIGSAGGHADMAGAQLDVTTWADEFPDDGAGFDEAVSKIVNDRFFDALETAPSPLTATEGDLGLEFPLE
jgi:nanoRNase/pAp phosphatase (c-di-AMP/oligoRNAs hydrolase)